MSAEAPVVHASEPAVHRREAGMPTPLVGMLLFIASEVMFFGGLFASYFNARAIHAGVWGPPAPAAELEALPIALPITIILIASIYGMNFRAMPELEWFFGYPMALGLMVAMGLVLYWTFRHNKWI